MTGMSTIKFTDPTDNTEGSAVDTTSDDTSWYNYDEKKWANAKTEDGSMWVWIPRYAYKVVYNDPNDKSKGGKFDVFFLIGTTVHPAFTNESKINYANGGWDKELAGI